MICFAEPHWWSSDAIAAFIKSILKAKECETPLGLSWLRMMVCAYDDDELGLSWLRTAPNRQSII